MQHRRREGEGADGPRTGEGTVRVEFRTTGDAPGDQSVTPREAEAGGETESPDQLPTDPGPPGADEPSAVSPPPIPIEQYEALARERDELRDRLLRTAAEFDNYRKRVDRDRREQSQWAAADLLGAILPIVDDLERALAADAAADPDGFRTGIELIHRQVLDLLARRGVVPIEAIGADFDPRIHEAALHEASESHRPGEVIAEIRRGYKLGDRLLRPSMVRVAKA